MNLKTVVKISNFVAAISIVLLIYWVFAFITVTVFGLKVFRENLSETFALSVLGLFALMIGSLMLNIMFNLTRIAEKHNQDVPPEAAPRTLKWFLPLIILFPIIFGLLFAGDFMTSKKKEGMLTSSALSIIRTKPESTSRLVNYSFDREWLSNARDTLEFFEKTDQNFPHASVIVRDELDGTEVFLAFRDYVDSYDENKMPNEPNKKAFLLRTTLEERTYLNQVFNEGLSESRFTAADGNYQLYYPHTENGKTIVFYFSDYQRYGKMGS